MNKAVANVAAPTVGSKRNAEGNITNHNSFSVLDNDIVMNLSNLMGVKVTENDFSTIDLLAEMENARLLLHQKNVSQNSVFNQDLLLLTPSTLTMPLTVLIAKIFPQILMNMFWFPPRGTENLPEKSCCPAPTKRKKISKTEKLSVR